MKPSLDEKCAVHPGEQLVPACLACWRRDSTVYRQGQESRQPRAFVDGEPLPDAAADCQAAGENMTFADCDEMLACLTAILDAHLLNGSTHCHMMRWKFRQLEALAMNEATATKTESTVRRRGNSRR